MESISPTVILLLVLSCLAIGLAIVALLATKTLNQKFQKSLEIINGLHKHVQQKDEHLMLLDERLSTAELKLRTETAKLNELNAQLENGIERLEQQVQDTQMQDPTAKRYQKANELLSSGVSIEEVMDICELPRAEVDILLGLLRRS